LNWLPATRVHAATRLEFLASKDAVGDTSSTSSELTHTATSILQESHSVMLEEHAMTTAFAPICLLVDTTPLNTIGLQLRSS